MDIFHTLEGTAVNIKLLLSVAVLACVGGCATAPSHPSLSGAALPDLIPVRDFVADRQATGGYSVSPDGKKLAWMGVSGVRPAVWVKTIGQNDDKAFPIRARYYRWSANSKYLALVADTGGDEDNHIYAGAVAGNDTTLVDLTPFEKTTSRILQVVDGGQELMVTANQRDKKVFDLYKIDMATAKHQLIATNPGTAAWWGVDRRGQLRARVLLEGDRSVLQVPASADYSSWTTNAQWGRFDSVYPIDFAEDGQTAWALSNRGRDKLALVKLDPATGLETVVYATPDVDIDRVRMSRKTHAPLIVHSMPGYPQQEIFDPLVRARLAALANGKPAEMFITSADDEERSMTVAVETDRGTKSYLYAGNSIEPVLLGENTVSHLAPALSSTQPITYTSRDGLTIHGYLTLPTGVKPEKLPMVLLVHGGPWARDRWGEGRMKQFLANRGYAVLQVNYRGSTGYGRAFVAKAIGEFAGKMHDDLVDGVHWAVKSGTVDPAKVAISGGSYGGYSALVGATFTPEVFACAVDFVGVTHLARLLETAPLYWELGLPFWNLYVGDPANPEQRKIMDAKSPLFKADQATKPILIMHGVNDPRVKLEQSELMVAALRKAGKQVDYVTFKGDGHGNQKWNNNLTMYRKTEDFLAKCLGGRSSGFDYYELGAWAF
jgi:dipeptidyl aminopeptidase/acylaminoacyl peptidase